ncbi:hypothetical protein Pfo_024052 [Paulownia fortunei]|nr:hypothetical protein Pfo_024052 [Paulownia fortunei]
MQKLSSPKNISLPNGDGTAPKNLNYPSMAVKLNGSTAFLVKFIRTVTNVGRANSTYKATTTQTSDYPIKVEPNILSFEKINERKSFVVTVSGESKGPLT